MLAQLNEQLAEYKLMARYQISWDERFRHIQTEIEAAKRQVRSLREQLYKEEQDVEQLQKLTLGTMLLALMGSKQRRLTKEQEEALAAKLKLEEAEDTLRDLEREKVELIAKMAELGQADQKYGQLLEQKRAVIMQHYPELAEQLNHLTEQENELLANYKELSEALQVGNSVMHDLTRASDMLDSAQNWGTYDMLGGGIIATLSKHSHIDEARSAIHAAQDGLRRLAKELKDVGRDTQIRLEVSGGLTFADFFFDGLIVDWIVQGRIRASQQQVLDKLHELRGITSQLTRETDKAQAQLQLVQRQINALIENS